MNKKRKLAASLTAGGMAAALLLTGTFAWRSISQKAKNEIMAETNPGGRLHDDFNGKNKDIYVENFTDEVEGAPIFARVRLREYMEVGVGAGNLKDPDRDVQVIGNQTAQFDDSSTWAIHQFGDNVSSTDHLVFHDYVTWDEDGGSTVYMPTFNKNKDSLLTDINGTLEGPDGLRPGEQGDKYDKYQDYKTYNVGDTLQGNAIYDADEDDDDEVGEDLIPDTVNGGVTVDGGSSAVDGVNYILTQETHEAKNTQDCTVITYDQWKDMPVEQQVGNYWVYDTDGWAYWAAPIMPNTATGLLLDGVSVTKTPGLEWYYAIDVEAQFSTANGWGTKDDGDGFYDEANGSMQDSGASVLDKAAESLNNKITINLNNTVEDLDPVDSFVAQPGDKARFSVWARINGKEHQLTMEELEDVTWGVTGSNVGSTNVVAPYEHISRYFTQTFDYSHNSALLTIDEGVAPGTTLNVTAQYQGLTDRVEVQVKDLGYEDLGEVIPGTLTTVTIDSHEWYVLAKNGDQVLLWADDSVGNSTYSGQVVKCTWANSEARKFLNNTFLPTLNILKRADVVVPTTLTSWDGMGYDSASNWQETVDSVFLLTEADLKGTASEYTGWSSTAGATWTTRKVELKDYTYQIDGVGQVVAPDVEMWKFQTLSVGGGMPNLSPLRSNSGFGRGSSYAWTGIGSTGWFIAYENVEQSGMSPLRPAMWVNLGVEVTP